MGPSTLEISEQECPQSLEPILDHPCQQEQSPGPVSGSQPIAWLNECLLRSTPENSDKMSFRI